LYPADSGLGASSLFNVALIELKGVTAVDVQTAFERSPLHAADGYHVLDTSQNPTSQSAAGKFFLIAGSVLLGVFGLLHMIWRLRPRKRGSAVY